MMLGLVQLLVGFVVAWEALEFVLRYGLLLSALKILVVLGFAAAASCLAVLYAPCSLSAAVAVALFDFVGMGRSIFLNVAGIEMQLACQGCGVGSPARSQALHRLPLLWSQLSQGHHH
jgi:hypothetical protein